jgi:hypothetical protein
MMVALSEAQISSADRSEANMNAVKLAVNRRTSWRVLLAITY